jgi:hypothetical protein
MQTGLLRVWSTLVQHVYNDGYMQLPVKDFVQGKDVLLNYLALLKTFGPSSLPEQENEV